MSSTSATTVLEVSGLLRASSKAVVEAALDRRPGVHRVEMNPVAQTATVTYDPTRTSYPSSPRVRDCDSHCAGRSVPGNCATRWRSRRPTHRP
jgi:P-type Cu2+ transporter